MKKRKMCFSLFAALALGVLSPNAPAQDATIIRAPDGTDWSRLGLNSGQLVQLDVDTTPGRDLEIRLPILGDVATMKLVPHSVRGENFKLLEARGGNVLVEVDPGPVNTLRGALDKLGGSIVAGGVMPDGLHLLISLADGSQYWLEPVGGRLDGLPKGAHVLYTPDQVVKHEHLLCGTVEAQHRHGPRHEGGYTSRGTTLYTAQVAVEVDFEYFGLYGSTALVNGRVNLIYNVINVQYERDVNILHTIATIIVNTTAADPYNTNTTGGMLDEMRVFWNANRSGIARDVAHLFTGKPTGGVIGTAYLGVICSSLTAGFGYGVSQTEFSNFNLAAAADLVAHETGHNWNSCHCTCSAYPNAFTMNPFITGINRFGGIADECSTNSIAAIVAHRNSRACLTTAADGPPPNDNCANATQIGPGTWGFNNLEATTDAAPVPAACGSMGRDIWYTYIAPHDGTVTVSTCGTHDTYVFDTVLAAYTGACGALTQIFCNDDAIIGTPCGTLDTGTIRDSYIQFPVVRGTQYRIRLGGFGGSAGQGFLRFAITGCTAPPNDICANAITIVDGSYPFSTVCANTDGFIDNATGCTAFSYQQTGSDIWYRYVGCGSNVTASICGADRNYDTRIAVYNSCPTGVFQAIACNDDSCGTGSSLTWTAANNVAYLIRVGGFSGQQGEGTLVVQRAQQANENCSTAFAITAPGGASGSTLCSSNDGSATCAASTTSPDVWYALTAPHTGYFYANTETSGTVTSNYDTALSVHTGCPGTIANQVVCDDDGGTGLLSRAVWYQVAGTTYYIRVNGFNNARGTYSLNVGPVPHDNCINAITIGVGTYLDSLSFATNEAANSAGACGASATNADTWYRFFAPCAGTLTVTTCGTHDAPGLNLGMDTVLGLYSTCGGAALSCNDDTFGTCGQLDTGIFRDSMVTANMTSGQSILIRVSKFSTVAAGPYRLNVSFSGTTCHRGGRLIAVDSGRTLWEVNQNTAELTSAGTVSANAGITAGLAMNCDSGRVFLSSTGNNSVYRLNLSTGDATLIGPYGVTGAFFHGLEFDDSTSTLYGLSSHNNGFYRIDQGTGAATLIGTTGFPGAFPNLGYNRTTNIMYATNGGNDSLYRIDRSNGAATLVGPLLGPTNPNGLAFNRDNGLMYLVDNTTDQLFLVNMNFGYATLIGPTTGGGTNLIGLLYVSNTCSSGVCHGSCVADFDDGSGTGNPDGGVTIEDLIYYLGIFDQGLICADVDDGSGTGNPDGGVTIEDLLYFLTRFDLGC